MLLVAQQSLVVIRHEGLTHVDSSLYTVRAGGTAVTSD